MTIFLGDDSLTKIHWEFGTAYDFFISLFVLANPNRFGLRASWAAGVRSRIPAAQRQLLEELLDFLPVPLAWVNSLSAEIKDTQTVLAELANIPGESRLAALLNQQEITDEIALTIQKIQTTRSAGQAELDSLRQIFQKRSVPVKPKTVQNLAQALMDPGFGDRLLLAYQSYFEVFFKDEEIRIQPMIEQGLLDAQKLAVHLPLSALVDELSKGVSVESIEKMKRLCLIPSYWSSPLVFMVQSAADEKIMVFGCRLEEQNLIPGEYVPDSLLSALKALSDSSRLRIASYLKEAPETSGSLAKKLRLRAPTVVHHLNVLRLAGLVQVRVSQDGERSYTLRDQAISSIILQIEHYFNDKSSSS
jgi:DNA-binding transcriptional ArsR family regulator